MNRNNYIIAFSGSCYSGKSTLIEKISSFCKKDNVIILEENIREYIDSSIDDIRANPSLYLDLQIKVIDEKIQNELKIINDKSINNKLILIDRSLVDSLFYFIFYVDKSKLSEDELKKYSLLLSKIIYFKENNIYNDIYFFKPIKKIQNICKFRPEKLSIIQDIEYDLMNILHDNVYNIDLNNIEISKVTDLKKILSDSQYKKIIYYVN